MRFVNCYKEKLDEENYTYAVCQCPVSGQVIEFPRHEKDSYYARYHCPVCETWVGIYVVSKKEMRSHGEN